MLAKFISTINSSCKTIKALHLNGSKAFIVNLSGAEGSRTPVQTNPP